MIKNLKDIKPVADADLYVCCPSEDEDIYHAVKLGILSECIMIVYDRRYCDGKCYPEKSLCYELWVHPSCVSISDTLKECEDDIKIYDDRWEKDHEEKVLRAKAFFKDFLALLPRLKDDEIREMLIEMQNESGIYSFNRMVADYMDHTHDHHALDIATKMIMEGLICYHDPSGTYKTIPLSSVSSASCSPDRIEITAGEEHLSIYKDLAPALFDVLKRIYNFKR